MPNKRRPRMFLSTYTLGQCINVRKIGAMHLVGPTDPLEFHLVDEFIVSH